MVKASKNDCATKTSSCAGTAKMDAQGDAFVVVPKGLCEKLAGGSLQQVRLGATVLPQGHRGLLWLVCSEALR